MKRLSQIFTIVLLCGILGYWCIGNLNSVAAGMENAGREVREREENHRLSLSDKSQIAFVYVGKEYFENFQNKYDYINLNGWYHKVLDYNQLNKITRLKNGYLAELASREDVSNPAGQLLKLSDQLKERGIPFVYVQAPFLVSRENPNLPVGIEDHANANADALLRILTENGVECLDLREVLEGEEADYYSYFFKTDHHWNAEGAFLGYVALTDRLSQILGTEVSEQYTNRANYRAEEYQDFFGSAGRRTGLYYAGTETFALLSPAFSSEYRLVIPEKEMERQGDFREALLDMTKVERPEADQFVSANEKLYTCDYYEAYIGGQYSLVQIENLKADNEYKVLLIKDSFALPIQCFLATWLKQTDAIDLRIPDHQKVLDYVDKNHPDVVIVFYNPFMIGNGLAFDFE